MKIINLTEKEYQAYLKSKPSISKQPKKRTTTATTPKNTLSLQQGCSPYPAPLVGVDEVVLQFVIPVPPVTKKNHSQIVYRGKFPALIPSKQYIEYEQKISPFVNPVKPIFSIDFPINLKCLFFQKTRAKSDLVGHLQAIQDALVTYGVLADDNHHIVVSTDGSQVFYDKDNPRTEITITRKK